MKSTIYKFILIVFSLVAFFSCNEDEFLTQTNPNEVSSDNFWTDLDDTQSGLNAAYASLRNYFIFTFIESSCKADMGYPGYGRPVPTSKSTGLDFYFMKYSATDASIQKKWEANYVGIFRANQVIEALNRIKGQSEVTAWTTQMAQARFLRGLFHFYLHSDFNKGSIIIRESVPKSQADLNKPLSTSAEVLAFFRADLLYAFENLPYTYDASTANLGKATKGTAATILGTSYLYENEIDKAKSLFDDVIKNPKYGYALESDVSKIFTNKGEFNKESIFEVAYSSTMHPEISVWDENSYTNRLAFYSFNSVGCYLPAWIAYAYKSEPIDTLDSRNYYSTTAAPTVKIKRSVPLRAAAMIAIIDDEQSVYYGGTASDKGRYGATSWGVGYYKKYTNHDVSTSYSESDNVRQNGLASGKNYIVNRLSEVYLMDAECMIKKNNVDSALILINAIRKRWGLQLLGPDKADGHSYDKVNYTTITLMDRLMYIEKPLELSVEGNSMRWNDLRRWGILKSNFDRLANSTYYFVAYKNSITGINKLNTSIVKDRGSLVNYVTVDYEYDIAANNYNSDYHDYLPIPLSEYSTNSALK